MSEDPADGEHVGGSGAPSYAPSMLVADVMVVLLQRGITARLQGSDLPQAHQAAWTLLDVLRVKPDTTRCPCLACGGADFQLAQLDLVAEDHPGLTGRRPSEDAGAGDGHADGWGSRVRYQDGNSAEHCGRRQAGMAGKGGGTDERRP